MKKITLSMVMITIAITVLAQSPQAFKYQAVARDNAGNVLDNQNVTFRFSILQGSASGTVIFLETHEAITNEFGLVNLEIGNGEPEIGSLAEIDWSTGEKFLEVELDPAGGYTFTSMGTTQLLSVPYSLYSESTGDTSRWRKNNDDLYFTNGNVGIGTDNPHSWAKLDVRGTFTVDGYTYLTRMDGGEAILDLYNTISDWELVAASDNNRFDIRKWGGVAALSISDNNFIGIGTSTPAGILDIAGAYCFPAIDGTSGQVLQTDGSGVLSWNNDAGATEINDLTDGRTQGNCVFLGSGAGANDDGSDNRNVAVGIDALNTNTSGAWNTANGFRALFLNTTGNNNTANGYQALYSNTEGERNTANGHSALHDNMTGNNNTANGFQALYFNTIGNHNTANGCQSLRSNTTGTKNTAFGYAANYYNQEGSNNTIIGYQAGLGTVFHNKSGNVFLGFQAGYNDTTDNKLYIENSLSSNPLIYGEFDNDLVRINGDLDVTGSFLNFGIDDLLDAKTLGNSVFLGSGAGANDDGTDNQNVAVGIDALTENTSGNRNTATGYRALYYDTTGQSNTATGHQALYNNTTGNYNTATGTGALGLNTTGDFNIANGFYALLGNTTGNYNTANGSRALGFNTTGNYNIGIGYAANFYNQEGSNNTIIGHEAGMGTSVHNKSGNVFLGFQAGYNDTTDNKLYIENSSSSTPLIWGDFANDTLRINGTFDINNAYHFPLSDGTSGQVLQTNGSGVLSWNNDAGATSINGLSDGRTIGNSVFLGSGAGANDDGTDNRNVAVGRDALNANISGSWNTANGFQTLYYNTIGNYNTANGYQSLRNNTTGDKNTAIGYAANYWNQEGSNNTIIGFQAGLGTSLHNKSGNVFLGYQAGYNDTTDNKLYIQNSASSTPLIYGEFDNDLLRVNGTFDINDAYQFPTTDGISGQVLQTDGSGVLSWNNDGGATEINDLTDGKTVATSVFLGSAAGANDDGTINQNVAVGDSALNANTSGHYCTAIGSKALFLNTEGNGNTAIGTRALYHNEGNGNTAIGGFALADNETGYNNTAIGGFALADNETGISNTANGRNSLDLNTTGSYNTGIGTMALSSNMTGNNNTAIGYQAGLFSGGANKSGSVCLGYRAGYGQSGDNKLYIDNSSSTTPLIYGDFSTDKVTINDVLILPPRSSFPLNAVEGELFVSDTHHIYCKLGGVWKQLD
ncbi:MAG: hypothetical protein ISS18_08535 [Bacteroidales bacterium]|nr:hypothetical protein [Bacteroidales bacterium]